MQHEAHFTIEWNLSQSVLATIWRTDKTLPMWCVKHSRVGTHTGTPERLSSDYRMTQCPTSICASICAVQKRDKSLCIQRRSYVEIHIALIPLPTLWTFVLFLELQNDFLPNHLASAAPLLLLCQFPYLLDTEIPNALQLCSSGLTYTGVNTHIVNLSIRPLKLL